MTPEEFRAFEVRMDQRFAALDQRFGQALVSLDRRVGMMGELVTAAQEDRRAGTMIHGLCDDTTCQTCVQQGLELGGRARAALAQEFEEALILAAGEPGRERVAQLIEAGRQMKKRGAATVTVVG